MSKTPETDKAAAVGACMEEDVCILIDHARRLELARNEARALAEQHRDRAAQIKARSPIEYEMEIKQNPLPWETE